MMRRSITAASNTTSAAAGARCGAHLPADDALLLVELVLRERLVVDDRDHAASGTVWLARAGGARRAAGARHRRERTRAGTRRFTPQLILATRLRETRASRETSTPKHANRKSRRPSCVFTPFQNSGRGSKLRSRCVDRRIVRAQVAGHRAPQEIEGPSRPARIR